MRRKGIRHIALFFVALMFATFARAAQTPLATLRYEIVGTQLQTSPSQLSVPKGIPGSVLVQLVSGNGSTNVPGLQLGNGAYVEALLRGPSFPARRVVGQLNQPLLLPPLNLVGDYQLDNIRLVDAASQAVRLESIPGSVPIRVFDEVLVSTVTSRPLTLQEIRDKGIVIDEQNFRAVEFQVAFVLEGRTIPVKFPVVSPTFRQSTEIIPSAELEARLVAAQAINQQIQSSTELPPELQTAGFNIQVQGVNFQRVDVEEQDLALPIPPIPALMIIPGNIGYLNQFFSVQIFTENAAPTGSGLSVFNVQAKLILPPGPDQVASTNYNAPGDDPLRFARVGPDKIISDLLPVTRPGPDNLVGTSDDIGRLLPGESGQAEFLVEGLQEGLHVMNLDLTADLDGLASGTVRIKGKAAGSVLVRNPKFSLAFSHPRTVRAGEPYDAFVTILNTSQTIANLVSVTLPASGLRGGVLETPETVQFETVRPGETATARFRIRPQKTGAISFSNLTTGEDSVQGRFRLSMGIDERGVILSPDTLLMPDYVNTLPGGLINAANRVLGQALSVSTAPQLPPGVTPVARNIITRRILELAEAGQRVRYGDPLPRVLLDLILDWQGGRGLDAGFDQILRETDAGAEFRAAVATILEGADSFDSGIRLSQHAGDFAGRSESWILAAAPAGLEFSYSDGIGLVTSNRSAVSQGLIYGASRGDFLAAKPGTNNAAFIQWKIDAGTAPGPLTVTLVQSNGMAEQLTWAISNAPACYKFFLNDSNRVLQVDNGCDGAVNFSLPALRVHVPEAPPSLITVFQDPSVAAGRPAAFCSGPSDVLNYGTVLSLLFSKPMRQEEINNPATYRFDDGNAAVSVQIQPGGRVALVNMKFPFSAFRPRTLTLTGISDERGSPLTNPVRPVATTLRQGVVVKGRAVHLDNSPAVGIPVTLTMNESSGDDCIRNDIRVAQVFTDESGFFTFDFVLAGVPYTVSATDTGPLSPETVARLLNSTAADAFSRENLTALASDLDFNNSLLAEFGAGGVPQAIAAVEGLDRAVLRDWVPLGSGRVGSEIPVALRFRGRGAVAGQILSADGATVAGHAAINLFPDPDSRELGRGLFTDANGRFAFNGVPLGRFSLTAQLAGEPPITYLGELTRLGEITNVTLVLNPLNATIQRTSMRGRVFENDNVTGHPRARVFVGTLVNNGLQNIVAAADADENGYWNADGIPIGTYDVVAISFDGKRKGARNNIAALDSVTTYVNLTLPGLATVSGRVENSAGLAVSNAIVAGGEALVRTDANGFFTLSGVPIGTRSISAGLERNPAAGIDFPKFGSVTINVLPGVDNFVVVTLASAGRIVGRVLDANGTPVGGARVAMPAGLGFQWVKADPQGNYRFENLGLGDYLFSAPSPPAQETDTGGLLQKLGSGSDDDIQAAIGEAAAIFTGAADPFLNGEGQKFNPGSWGFTRARLGFDGQTVVADIRFLREGTIAGTVLNGQGVPIGARVRLTGVGPLANGAPGIVIRGERNSDPALGTFSFFGQALVGDWTLQAASPFYPTVITQSGRTSSIDPDATNIVLQFPLIRDSSGRLTGRIFNPDGTPAGSGVQVRLSADYVLTTDTNGVFDTQVKIASGNYTLQVSDPASGLVAQASALVQGGITNLVNVTLLGEGGLRVNVFKSDGTPATNAAVEIDQGTYPNDHFEGTTGTNGAVDFENIFEGRYAITASMPSGPTRIYGRAGALVVRGQTAVARVDLAPTAGIRGVFLKSDLATPIAFAQVLVGDIGFATTDTNGFFEVNGVPLGTYRLTSKDPVTGHFGIGSVTLTFDSEIKQVQLVEQIQFRGEIFGRVLDMFGTSVVSGVSVTLSSGDSFAGTRTVTTGADGRFSFPDTIPGAFSLTAIDPQSGSAATRSAVLPDRTGTFEIDILLPPLASLAGTILEPGGLVPATNATVLLGNRFVDTDGSGQVFFTQLSPGNYEVRATSRLPAQTRSAARTNLVLTSPGPAPGFTLVLRGVGSVAGQVVESDGLTPVPGAEVRVEIQSPLFLGDSEIRFTDPTGHFTFGNIPVGDFRLVAQSGPLAASHSGTISNHNETASVKLVLGDNGAVTGRLVRQNGITPVAGVDVLFEFTSQSGLPGRAVNRTDTNGIFFVENIPVGNFSLIAVASAFDGIAFKSGVLTANGQLLDLGAVRFDEDDPRVIQVTPADTAVEIPITAPIELVFNEALAPGTVSYSGIYLRSASGIVPGTVQLQPNPINGALDRVRIVPDQPLVSLTTYEIIGIDGEHRNASGNITGLGVTDLVGRPLTRPFISTFTTADNDPPRLVSIFPTNSATQIDPRAVMRLSFSEPIRDSNYVFALAGPAGAVPGSTSVGLNGLVVVFTPSAELAPNSVYTLSASGIRDLAGNLALNQPYSSTFTTIDTLGPVISALRLVSNAIPVAGAAVDFEAILATNEPGVSVRFTQDFNPIALATASPFRAKATLPTQGATTIRAIARDPFGNDGPVAELVVNVVSNQPPVVQLTQSIPVSGPLFSGQIFHLMVSASDDYRVTNIQVTVSGPIVQVTNFPNGSLRTLVFAMPSNTIPGSVLHATATATDALGLGSAPVDLALGILDGSPPALNILSPTNDAVLDPARPLDLVVQSSDNSTNHLLELTVSGVLVATQTVAVATPVNVVVTNHFLVGLSNTPPAGGLVQVQIRATDPSGNVSLLARTFRLPDSQAPRLISANPANGAVRQSLWPGAVAFDFDEPLDPATAITNNVIVTSDAATTNLFTVSLENGNRRLLILLPQPLTPGATYTNTLLPGLTDGSGNRWRNLGGTSVPPGGAGFAFTTADILEVAPTNGTRIVPGQSIGAHVNFEPGLGASFFRFRVNSNAPVDVSVTANATNAAALVPLEIDAAAATLTIEAHRSGDSPYSVGTIALNLRPRSADDDNDGMPNGFEADFGFNPFDPADAALDADGDTLSNLQEFIAGTSPLNPDTDGDGLRDDVDPEPLNPDDALRPVTLTFDIGGIGNGQNMDPNYGDRVTNHVMGSFQYGGLDPFAPNVRVSYGAGNPSFWSAGFGSLTNVLYENTDTTGALTVQLAADAGFVVNLHRFDLAASTAAFGADPVINSVQVLDYFGNVIFATNNVSVSRTQLTRIAFSPAISENALTIRINALNPGVVNRQIAIDNIRFSQGGAEVCQVAPADLVSSWRAEGNAFDSVGTNHGTLQNGVTFVAGRIGNAFSFDGVDDYVVIPSSFDLKLATEITAEGWINLRTVPGGAGGAIVAKGVDAESPVDWAMTVTPGGRLRPHLNRAGNWQFFDGNTVLSTGVWHHVAMVYDGSTLRSYLDGELDGIQPGTGNIQTSDGSLRIGAYAPVNGTGSKAFFPGLIDELNVYNRALASNEIASLSSGTGFGNCPPDQDTDGDGMPDAFELRHRLNPHLNDAALDPDHDGLSNLTEYQLGTAPRRPDTDGDGMGDGFEVLYNFDPLSPADAAADADGDGVTNLAEFRFGSNPRNPDSDGDGMPDFFEWIYGLDPNANDTLLDPDGDGLSNLTEFQIGTNPRSTDSDGDGINDAIDPHPTIANQKPIAGSDPDNHALRLDGADDFVAFGNWFTFQTFTIGIWVKAGAPQNDYADILDNTHQGNINWVIQQEGSAQNRYIWGDSDLSPAIAFNLVPNQWQYLVITRDSNRVNSLYLDGNLVGSATGTRDVNYDGQQFLRGGRWGYGGRNWNGAIDQFGVWSNALSAAAIQENMGRNLVGNEPGLAGLWTFDEISGAPVIDRSGNGRDGSLGAGNTNAAPARIPGLDAVTLTVTSSVLHVAITLTGSDPDGDAITAQITRLPLLGRLYQTADGLTRGALIASVPTTVTDPARRVLYAPPRAFTTNDLFQFRIHDGFDPSEDALRSIQIIGDPLADLDGDGMTDRYEVENQLNPEINDAAEDPDGDGLTNLQEFQHATRARIADTDGDGLTDGAEVLNGTNPLDADTDHDGLRDGVDPHPLIAATGVDIAGPAAVTVREGETTNLTFLVASGRGPLLLVDHPSTNLPPAFALMTAGRFSNTDTNGSAEVILQLSPLHDAAGVHHLTIRGIAADGIAGTADLTVTVLENSSLLVTRWADAVNGNWNDPARWSDGVPTSNRVALIDVPGTFTVTLNAPAESKGIVLNNSNAVLQLSANLVVNSPLEIRQGSLVLSPGFTHTFNRGLVNRDRVRMMAGDFVETSIDGLGLVNQGRLEIGISLYAYTRWLLMPVRTEGGGVVQLNDDPSPGYAPTVSLKSRGDFTINEGTLHVPANWIFGGNGPPGAIERIAIGPAAALEGSGVIHLRNENTLEIGSRTNLAFGLQMFGPNTALITAGSHFDPKTGDRLQSRINAEVFIQPGVEYTQQDGSTWQYRIRIQNGGILNLNPNLVHTFNRGLVNEGRVVMRSGSFVEIHVRGSSITNRGDFEIQSSTYSGPTRFFLPIWNENPGSLTLNDGVSMHLDAGGDLTIVSGTFTISSNAVLRLEDGGLPAERLTLRDPAVLAGNGRIEIYNQNILDLDSRNSLPFSIQMVHPTAQLLTTGGQYLVKATDRLQGTNGFVLVVPDGVAYTQIDGTTWPQQVHVQSGGTLSLNAGLIHTFNGGLLVDGNLLVRAADFVEIHLRGSGITNRGTIEIQHSLYSGPTRLFAPLWNESPGTVTLNNGGGLHLETGANMTMTSGTLTLNQDSVLRLYDGADPAERLVLRNAAVLAGTGKIEIFNQNILDLDSRTSLPYSLQMVQPTATVLTTGGQYTIKPTDRLQGSNNFAIVIGNGVSYTQIDGTTWPNLVHVENGGTLNLNAGLLHTFNGGLLVDGSLVVRAADFTEIHLRGAGITNRGNIEIQHSLYSGPTRLFLPLWNESPGMVTLNSGGGLHLESGADFTMVSGTLTLNQDSVLRLYDGSDPAERFTLRDAAVLAGNGKIEIFNQNILDLDSRTSLPYTLQMIQPTATVLTTGGQYAIQPADRLQGSNSFVVVVPGGVAYTQIDGTTWPNLVQVENGGTLNLNPGLIHTFNGGLLNQGRVIVRGSDFNEIHLKGIGITNQGTFEIQHSTFSGPARLFAPLWNELSGILQLNDSAFLDIQDDGGIVMNGGLQMNLNSELRFVGTVGSAESLILGPASPTALKTNLTGTGTIRFFSNNLLALQTDADFGALKLYFQDAASVSGTNLLRIGVNGALTVNESSLTAPGSLDILGALSLNGAGQTFQVNGTLTLESGGVLNNPGTVRAGVFVNNGGAINGNAPVPIGGAGPQSIRIDQIFLGDEVAGRARLAHANEKRALLHWKASPGSRVIIETSVDLEHWTRAEAAIRETAPGNFEGSAQLTDPGRQFFRVRIVPSH